MQDLIIGVDVGTTTVKSAVFTLPELLEPIAVSKRPSVTRSPRRDWSETDPEAVVSSVFETLREAAVGIDPARVAGIGISGTACGAWLMNSSGHALRPAILWNDGRAADITRAWDESGSLGRIFEIGGNVPFPGYTLSVLAWLDEHEPDAWSKTDKLLWCKDWVRYHLTGVAATEESEASYVPFDIRRRTWSDELLELTGTSRWRGLLPDLLPHTMTHPLNTEAAGASGLLAGTPVATGLTDIVAGLVGAGATRPGGSVTILGTSANSTVVSNTPAWEPRNVGIMAASPNGRYARSLINTSGSATIDWGARLLTDGDVGAFMSLAAQATAAADGLILVPYLSPAGTVSPRVDPNATGTLTGIRIHHDRADVARAIVEGVAFAVADCYANIQQPVDEIVAVGGAARSDLLLQALADLADRPVIRLAGDEFGARGAAVQAAHAIDAVPDLDDLSAAVRPERRFEPDSASPLGGSLVHYQAVAQTSAPPAGEESRAP